MSSYLFVSYSSIYFIQFSMNTYIGQVRYILVGSSGLEPPTSRVSGARSNHLSYEPIQFSSVYLVSFSHPILSSICLRKLFAYTTTVWHIFVLSLLQPWQYCRAVPTGGDDGNRTHDPLLAGQVLSQLSYTPISYMRYIIEFPFGHSKLNNKL